MSRAPSKSASKPAEAPSVSRATVTSADPSLQTLAVRDVVEAALPPGVAAEVSREVARHGHTLTLRSERGRTRIFVGDALSFEQITGAVLQAGMYLEVRQ